MELDQFFKIDILRQEAYHLLSVCFSLPNEDLPNTNISLKKTMKDIYPGISDVITSEIDYSSLDHLKIDYAKLFIGPFKLLAPPYGSVYIDGQRQVMGESTIEVQKRYQEAGLEIAKNFHEAPDHIAAELEFLHYLIYKEIEALERTDWETARHFLKLQSKFLQDHLGAWVLAFAINIEENAETEFYKSLAKITKLFIQKDMANLLASTIPDFSTQAAAE